MDRRSFLSAAAGVVAATSGCIGDGRVVLDRQKSVTIQPGMGWWAKLPDVGGNGALSFTVRAEQPFDVYYFTGADSFGHYETYVTGGDPPRMPPGHRTLSQAAVERDGEFGVQVPRDGGRESIDTEGEHYFAVDHSNYGAGVPVEQYGDPLQAFVDLKVIEEQSPL
ncbi:MULTISPECIES: twin-arginine translocation signal domain-containing protein [Salinibaculum]|uniref:twin-arginine translocation signal domain-containing protein n=1 Tax=Salinibaculum TaxID=2732368 RepID=UPI0030CF34DB